MGTLDDLAAAGLDLGAIDALIRATLAEDLGGGVDVTTVATVPEAQVAHDGSRARGGRGGRRDPGGRAGVRDRVRRREPR